MRLGKFISISWEILPRKKGKKARILFFTFISPLKLIVDVIEPNYGRILDPACGAGGMMVSTGSRKNSVNKKELRESISRNLRFDEIESMSFSFT